MNLLDAREFVRGLGFAVMVLMKRDEPSLAAEIIRESGHKLAEFKFACDKYDFKYVKKCFEQEVNRETKD